MNLKTMNGETDKIFIKLFQLLKEILPEKNALPSQNYEENNILFLWVWNIKRYIQVLMIVLYIEKEFEELHCPKCGL